MKKLLNKALLFQWFYLGKWVLLASMFLWALLVFSTAQGEIYYTFEGIKNMNSNNIAIDPFGLYVFLISFLFAIFVFGKGLDKRTKAVFITSGPFTKKQVLFNEVIAMIISLMSLIVMGGYIFTCIYIKNLEKMSLVVGYGEAVTLTLIRLLLVGLMFIVYIMIIDHLFSNMIIGVVALVGAPLLLIGNLIWMGIFIGQVFSRTITGINIILFETQNILHHVKKFFFMERLENYWVDSIGAFIALGCMIVGFLVLLIINKASRVENMNKFFVFPWVEKVTVTLITLLGSLICGCFIEGILKYNLLLPKLIVAVIATVATIVVYIVFSKLIKGIVKLVI